MAGVSDEELTRLTGFTAGVNNVAPQSDLPKNEIGQSAALREAVNVDLVGPSKKVRRRKGYTLKIAGRFHSPGKFTHAPVFFCVKDGDLMSYDSLLNPISTVRAGVGETYISYALVNDDLYWSNGVEFRRIRDDLTDTPGWIDCPGTPNVIAVAGGGMTAGAYRVAMTWLDEDGRESGANGVAMVDVGEGQGIQVNNIPVAPENAVKARLYCSPPDGEEMYAAMDLLLGVSQTMLGAGAGQDGKALDTLWRQPLPPCNILRYWNGRLLGASENLLVWSDALLFGLTTHDNYIRMGAVITLLEPIGEGGEGSGCWIADHARTYWMAGGNPKDWRRVIRYDHPAIPGTSIIVKGTDIGLETTESVAFWLSANGVFCAGLPGGKLIPMTEGQLALPDGEHGASLFREHDGLRQLITSYLSASGNGLAVGDSVSASVTHHP